MSDSTPNAIPTLTWGVALLGPSRVGKTSLLTSLRVAGQAFFSGTPINVEPVNTTTAKAFDLNDNLMKAELSSRSFSPESLPGDSEEHRYGLSISPGGVDGYRVALEFRDYPGAWLTDQKERVHEILSECPAVLIPIDATLLMEAGREHSADMILGLALTELEEFLRKWAKQKLIDPGPDQVILAPVKCESYFADNGGRRDQADALFRAVEHWYEPIVKAVKSEHPEARVLYAPVDTIGPIELLEVEWMTEGLRRMKPSYRVRSDAHGRSLRRCVRGAEPILASLVGDLLELLSATMSDKGDELHEERKKYRSNWFKSFIDTVSGGKDDRERKQRKLAADKALADANLRDLAARADALRASEQYNRVRTLS